MKHNYDETLYTKWLQGALTPEELDLLEQSGDLKVLQAIKDETDNWMLPQPKNRLPEILSTPKKSSKPKVIKFVHAWRVAASIILIAALSYFTYSRFFDITTYNTLAQENKEIILPDGSMIILDSNSELSYNNYKWEDNREVNLKGQAFFKVTKKGDFLVNFKQGKVAVLGTEFDIIDHNSIARVTCFEGKVKATLNNENYILEQGMGVNLGIEGVTPFTTDLNSPTWSKEVTIFKNASFAEIIAALELKYGITIEYTNAEILKRSFSGQFVNNNIETALKMVTAPLGFDYTIEGLKVTISTK